MRPNSRTLVDVLLLIFWHRQRYLKYHQPHTFIVTSLKLKFQLATNHLLLFYDILFKQRYKKRRNLSIFFEFKLINLFANLVKRPKMTEKLGLKFAILLGFEIFIISLNVVI